jgi:hypothetical protein
MPANAVARELPTAAAPATFRSVRRLRLADWHMMRFPSRSAAARQDSRWRHMNWLWLELNFVQRL